MDKRYNMATKAYLAQGRDGYSVFSQAQVVMDGETLPMLADLLRSHLASISYINSILVTLPDGTQVLRPQESTAGQANGAPQPTPPRTPSHHDSCGSAGSRNTAFSRSPSSVVQTRNRRRLAMERLAASVHVASADEAAQQLEQIPGSGAVSSPDAPAGGGVGGDDDPTWLCSSSMSRALLELLRGLEKDEREASPSTHWSGVASSEPKCFEGRFQVCARMDGRINNVKPTAPSRATSGDAEGQSPKA